jgi:hypothetical protein
MYNNNILCVVSQVVIVGKSGSTEIIKSVVPIYGAIWCICAHKAAPERGKTFQKYINVLSKKNDVSSKKNNVLSKKKTCFLRF